MRYPGGGLDPGLHGGYVCAGSYSIVSSSGLLGSPGKGIWAVPGRGLSRERGPLKGFFLWSEGYALWVIRCVTFSIQRGIVGRDNMVM